MFKIEDQTPLYEVCCVCNAIRLGEGKNSRWIGKSLDWVYQEALKFINQGSITHGYCPQCYEKALAEIGSRQISEGNLVALSEEKEFSA